MKISKKAREASQNPAKTVRSAAKSSLSLHRKWKNPKKSQKNNRKEILILESQVKTLK